MTGARQTLTPGPLTARMVAQAVVAAAAEYGFDPESVFAPVRDGRGRVRLLAAAALIHPQDRPAGQCAKLLGVQTVQISPSALARRGVTAEALARVWTSLARMAATSGAAAAGDLPLNFEARRRRGEPDYVDPRRDAAREARMLTARRAGQGPRAIAQREGMSLSATKALFARVARETGEVFPEVPPGPNRGGRPRKVRTDAAPNSSPPRKRGRPRKTAVSAVAARPAEHPAFATTTPPPTQTKPSPPVEPFPRGHSAWTPLPGTTPVRLIDHRSGCRWPVTVEGARDDMVCNAAAIEAVGCGPYCGRHAWLSLGPAGRARLAAHAPSPASEPPRMARPAGADELKDA